MKQRYTYEQCQDALERLGKYMELLNEQMAYTKDEIAWYSRHYKKACAERIKAGQPAEFDKLIDIKRCIIYYTKEELQK